ncbi:MAG: hypothetical protein KBT20_08085 [Bacteroidales bacterium]|nr:hypothetical protein [Candidatus Liminaster caballi]
MKKLLFASLAALSLVACTSESAKQDPREHFQIYLCIGQSNMVGAARPEAQDSIVPDRFLNLAAVNDIDRTMGEWRPATPPLCRRWSGLGPVDYFGRTMLEYIPETDTIGIIEVAVNGTSIVLFDKEKGEEYCHAPERPDWMAREIEFYDHKPYERLITLARQAQQRGVIKGILLHQGCTDAYNDQWLANVHKIYNDILNDLGLDAANVPLLAGEAIGADQNGVCKHANPCIDRLHDSIPNGWVISSHNCEAGPDNLHFSAAGYRRLGRRYGIKMLQLQGYNVENDTDCELQCEYTVSENAFDVKCEYSAEKMTVAIESAEALTSVDIVSYSGATLATVEAKGEKNIVLDVKPFANEDRLVLNIHSEGGKTVNKQIDR